MSAIHFEATFDDSKLRAGIQRANKTVGEWAANAQKNGQAVDNTFGNLQKRFLQFASIHFAQQIGGEIIKVRGEFQQLGIAFETMLGSKAKADKLMQDAIVFAQKTPFTLTDVATNIKQLMAMGIETEKVMDTMKSLGDVAAGVSVPISRIAINYGQVAALGRLQQREIRDFAMAGIPIVEELAKQFGKTSDEINDMVAAGQIGFPAVEKAFASMAGEGGKFYNLMEKQNKSVTGQISNLQDKLQVMFNSIGKANEGLIYGGISGLSDLVENYQDVLDVLKFLVVTYGSYRAALLLAAAAQKAIIVAGNIQAWFQLARGIKTAKDAQIAFNLATKANPYGLMIAGIGALISYLLIFRDRTKDAADMTEQLTETISQIGKQQEINGLIKKYDELKDKTELTDDEQKELNSTIQELSTIFPDAISQVDKYGKAIDLVREKLVANNKELQVFLENSTKQEIFEGQKKLDELIATRDRLVKELNTGTGERSYGTGGLAGGTTKKTVDLTKSELAQNKEDLDNIIKDIDGLASKLTESQRKLLELGSITAEESLKPYKDLFKELGEYTTKQLYDTKAKLTALLSEGFGADAEAKIKQQIDSIASKLGEPTIKQQIEATTKALEDAQKKLTDLRDPENQASVTQIEEQETVIKDLVEKIETLTGVKEKETKKQLKTEEEKLKALQDLAEQEISISQNLEQSKVAIMRQGVERQRKEAELSYRQRLIQLQKQNNDYLDKLNESKGLKITDKGYITELPEDIQGSFNRQKLLAEKEYNNQVAKINKDTADSIQQIWHSATEGFISDVKAQERSVNDKYDNLIKKAKELGASQSFIGELEDKRSSELSKIMVIDWIEAFGELDKVSTDALESMRDKLKQYISQLSNDINKDELKELVKTFEDIDRAISERKPISAFSDAIIDLKYQTDKLNALKEQLKYYKEQKADLLVISRLEEQIKNTQKDKAESAEKATNGLNEIGRQGSELVSAIREYTDMLENFGVDIGDQGREIIDGVGQIMNGLESIDLTKPFSIITGTIKAAAGLGNVIASLLGGGDSELSQKTFDRYDDLMTTMDQVISKQKQLLDSMAGAEAVAKSDEAIAIINKQIDATKKLGEEWLNSGASWKSRSHGYDLRKSLRDFADEFDAIGIDLDSLGGRMEGLFSLGPDQLQMLKEEIPEAWARIDDRTREYLQTIIDSGEELEGMKDQLNETLTGLSFDSARDSLQDLLLDADSTMADLADNFEKYMKEAIVGTLIDGPLKAKMQEWYNDFAEAIGDDGILDKNEKEQLRKMYETIFQEGQSLRDMAFSAAGLDFGADAATQAGLSGAIRREMTEETAGELAGTWRRTTDDTRQIRDYTKTGINHLVAIEANTFNTVVELQKAVSKLDTLDEIAANTKPAQTSRDLGL